MENGRRFVLSLGVLGMVAIVIIASFVIGHFNEGRGEENARFEVSSLTIDRTDVLVNHSVCASVLVSNAGNGKGTYTLDLYLDGGLNQSKEVELEAGEHTDLLFNVTVPTVGVHELSIGGDATNTVAFTSYPRWQVGDYITTSYERAHYDSSGIYRYAEISNRTQTVIAVNETDVTVAITFDNGLMANSTITNTFEYLNQNVYAMLTNISMVGKESVLTYSGEKLLSHYSRSDPWPTYDVYIDVPTQMCFKQVTSIGVMIITEELIDTNMPWVAHLAPAG